jgi:DNA modification methylase
MIVDISGVGWHVLSGSCLDRLPELADESVDAVVCDPPYELGFMGKKWDSSGIAFDVRVWAECLRVLKPGGHLLAFGGSRTWHRIAVAIEDAGFDIRDSVAWLYGSGFPKSLDVSKAIDKAAGVERKIVGQKDIAGGWHHEHTQNDDGWQGGNQSITAPATPDAQKWQGWGTALKPAFEPVIVARKPLIGTVAENVLLHGVGGLNIDGTRIGSEEIVSRGGIISGGPFVGGENLKREPTVNTGRWPSNVMLDEFTAALVDEQSGITKSTGGSGVLSRGNLGANVYGDFASYDTGKTFRNSGGLGDVGGASRFFYVAKASKRDRNEGLDGLETKQTVGGGGLGNPVSGAYGSEKAPGKNFHPTVKPTDLMRQLVRLVTPHGGLVLDPFTGSGSTGKAAILEGFEFVGCELTDDYLPIIEGRLNHAVQTVADEQAEAVVRESETLF